MSKLHTEYLKLKQENSNKLYLLKSGMFYVALEDDARKLSELFEFKLTNLNDTVIKCGFPEKRLDFYTNILKNCSIDFEIINFNYNKICNYPEYLNNPQIKKIIEKIKNLDMNEISLEESFEILKQLNENLTRLNFNNLN